MSDLPDDREWGEHIDAAEDATDDEQPTPDAEVTLVVHDSTLGGE